MEPLATARSKFILKGKSSAHMTDPPVTAFENFGEFEEINAQPLTEIDVSDVTIDADLFTKKLRQLPCGTSEIRVIRFENIQYTNKFLPVFLPSLESFHFHAKPSDDEKEELFHATSIFFFQRVENQEWDLGDICAQHVNIEVKFGNVDLITVDHVQKYLFLGIDVASANRVLRRCQLSLDRLALHFSTRDKEKDELFDIELIPSTLKSLDISCNDIDWSTLDKRWDHLEELAFKKHWEREPAPVVITHLPPNLRKLCLYQCIISIPKPIEHMLEAFSCLNCTSVDESFMNLRFQELILSIQEECPYIDQAFENRNVRSIYVKTSSYNYVATIKSPVLIEILKTSGLIARTPDSTITKMITENEDLVLIRDQATQEWTARTSFLEERDTVLKFYVGLPIRTSYRSWSSGDNYKNDFLEDTTVHISYPPKARRFEYIYIPAPPKFEISTILNPVLIRHIWLEDVRLYSEDLEKLRDLPNLYFLTVKNCLVSTQAKTPIRFLSGVNLSPRLYNGLVLSHIPRNIKGVSILETPIVDFSRDDEVSFDYFNYIDPNVTSSKQASTVFKTLSAKQSVLRGIDVTSNQLESLLKNPVSEIILVDNIDRRKCSSTLELLLTGSGLDTWENRFILMKKKAVWHGQYISYRAMLKYSEIGSKFKNLQDEYQFDPVEEPVDSELKQEYSRVRGNKAFVIDYRLPSDIDLELKRQPSIQQHWERPPTEPQVTYDTVTNALVFSGGHDYNANGGVYDVSKSSYFECGEISVQNSEYVKNLTVKTAQILIDPFASTLKSISQNLSTMCLHDVELVDYFPTIHLPNLRHLEIILYENTFSNEIIRNEQNLQRFLLFFLPMEDQCLAKMWELNTNITFGVGRGSLKYLEINHDDQKLSLCKLSFLLKILNPTAKIKRLTLNSICDVDFSQLNKSALEILSIQDDSFFDWDDIQVILEGMTNLVELYFHRKPFGRRTEVNLKGIPASLKVLCLSDIRLSETRPVRPLDLDHLALLDVGLTPTSLNEFQNYFNPKRLIVTFKREYRLRIPKYRPSYEILRSLVQKNSRTEWIYVSDFDRHGNDEEMEHLMTSFMVPEFKNEGYYSTFSLNLDRQHTGIWRHSEMSQDLQQLLSERSKIFEDFCLSVNSSSEKFKNQIIYFDGFGSTEVNGCWLRSIQIEKAVINTDLFRNELARCGTSGLETIILRNCTFMGHNPLQLGEIPMPNLKHFEIDCSVYPDYSPEPQSWDNLKPFLWFRKGKSVPSLKNLWHLGIYLAVKPYGSDKVMLEICPEKKKLYTTLDESNALLKSAENVEILSFIVRNQVPLAFPLSLKFLELDSPLLSWEEVEDSLRHHDNIQEIHFGTKSYSCEAEPLAVICQLPKNLSKLKFYRVLVSCKPSSTKNRKLQMLSFRQCKFTNGLTGEKLGEILEAEAVTVKD